MPHIFISAAHKSSGKTTLTIGLTAALKVRGLAVQTFKKGPDYIDPLWLTAAGGRSCRNLDFFTMSKAEIKTEFSQALEGAAVGIIEGNKGLYDGLDLDGKNSNAALAKLLQTPVLLVIDARGMTRGIAPLILGYQAFDPEIRIRGVILNQVGGTRHEGKLRRVIEHYTDIPVVGAVGHSRSLVIDERHLGLMPSNETNQAQEKIGILGSIVADQVDIERVLDIAGSAPACATIKAADKVASTGQSSISIGYPQDRAFGFYYPGDLEKMRAEGARLVPFDSLQDADLPDVDGLFLGGGFPETVMERLESNAGLREQIRQFVESGGPVYAECGGLMYLARSLSWKGKTCKMAGVIPGDAVMHEKPQGRGYVLLEETGESPWRCHHGTISAHEFHYSALQNLDGNIRFAYRVKRGTGLDGRNDGIVYKNLLASYTHLRDAGGNHWTHRFLSHVRSCKEKK